MNQCHAARVRLFSSEGDVVELPPGHRFPMAKYERVRAELARELPALVHEAPRASWDDLSLAHDAAYLGAVRDGTLPAAEVRRLGLPWSEALVARSRRSTGGTLAALAWAMEHGAAGHLAGGTHHAFRDRGEGFCVFNDLATAALVARRDHGVRRLAVVDLDVHQGNGTAALLRGDPGVFTLSLHGAKNYPFQKEVSSLDVELPDGCEDADYLRALDGALEAVAAHRPELILYQAGVDALAGDRLGRLALTHEGLRRRDARVFELTARLGVPLVVTLGGGYGRDIEATIAAHKDVYRGLVERLG
ncbi:histone deacetylase family protein [Sorangium sp. So ce1151]|uniref:histone deacetylase family protein n=1 Tax=Sorangium sp. So ce1151 TaxID=3133332 RepID=UPI003F6263B2